MGASDQQGDTKPQTAHRWTTQIMSHFVTVQDEAARSTSLSYLARATTIICLGIQIYLRLFGNSSSQLSELLVSQFAELLLLVLIMVPTLLFAFFTWSCFVPSGKRLQKWTLESGLPHILLSMYVGLNMINALLVLPVSLAIYSRVLFWTPDSPGGLRGHIFQDLIDKMSVAALSLLYVMIVPTIISVFSALAYSSFGISLLRSGDFLSSSNRAIFLVLPGTLFITLICNTLTSNMQAPEYSAGPGIFVNVFGLGLSLLGILVASYYTVFYHRGYRQIFLQGNWMLFVSTLFDMIYAGMERRGSMRLALFMFIIFIFGSRLITNLDYFVQVVNPQSEYISLRMILSLEQAFHEYGLGNPALSTMMLKVKSYLLKNRDPTKVSQISRSSSEIETSNQELIGSYLFNLFDKACWSSSKMSFMLGLHFANYLSSQKTNYLYLAILIRKMKDTDLSFSESFHIHRLETLITQSLKQKEIESSGSIHDQRRADKTTALQSQKTSLNLYKTVETINLYEQLMKSMRKQIDLVVGFYEHLEQPTTWIVKLHEIVEQINKGRVVCSELFDKVDEASSSMQAFHILPYALFLEQTENNFEKGTELVKYYDSKTNLMFKHLGRSIRESLLENSITLVVEAEKGRLGNIVFTSRNMRQAFGPEVPDLDGQSLDLFFHSDMAKVHQMELERFLGKLDKDYLGYRQPRYVTFGNNIYYRVTVVTKFVPHIEDGFRLVILIKNLSLDLADGNPSLMDTISFAVDDRFQIVGVCHNKDIFRAAGHLNPAVEALVGQPLEVVSPESRELLEVYFNVLKNSEAENLREKRIAKKKLLLSIVGEKRYRKFFNNEDIFAGNTLSTRQGKLFDRNSSKHTDADVQNFEENMANDELETQMQQLEEEVQALKAGIQDHKFPQMGVKVSLQLVQLKQDQLMPEVVIVPAIARLESFRMEHVYDESTSNQLVNEAALKFRDRESARNREMKEMLSTRRELRDEMDLGQSGPILDKRIGASLAILSLSLREIQQEMEATMPEANKQKNYLGGVTLGLFRGDSTSALQSEMPKSNTIEEKGAPQPVEQRDDQGGEKSLPKQQFRTLDPKFIVTTKESIEISSPRIGVKAKVLPKLTLTTAPQQETPIPKLPLMILPKLQKKVLTKFCQNPTSTSKPDEAIAQKESLKKLYEQKYNDDRSMSQLPSAIDSMPSDTALKVAQNSNQNSLLQNKQLLRGGTTLVGVQADKTDESQRLQTGWQGLRTTFLPAITELRYLFGAGSSLVEENELANAGPAGPGENYIKSNSRSVVRSKQGLLLEPN